MTRPLLAPILALALLVAVAPPASADCDPAGPLPDELRRAAVAFVGTVTATTGPVATFTVTEVWAGTVGPVVEVRGLLDLAPGAVAEDDRTWETGGTYLVIPFRDGGVLRDHICTATVPWSVELGELRPDGVEAPGADESGAAPWSGLAVGALAAFVGIASFMVFRRRVVERG